MKRIILVLGLFAATIGRAFADAAPEPGPSSGCGGKSAASPVVIAASVAGAIAMGILMQRRRSRQGL